MLLTVQVALIIAAFLAFVAAAFGVVARVNWIGVGLALYMLSLLIR